MKKNYKIITSVSSVLIILFIFVFFFKFNNEQKTLISIDKEIDSEEISESVIGWHNDAVFYHVWIKSFADSNDKDIVGDIKGLINKLDYLNDGKPETDNDLGITAIWLSPIFDCALKSTDPNTNMHGYDVVDFYNINKIFGSLKDVEKLIFEAHKRKIKLILDFTPNQTSIEHPWFLNAKNNGTKKDWYVWNKSPEKEKWIIPWGGGDWKNVWNKHENTYYYNAFPYGSYADLNFENKEVRDEINKISKFWLDKGFDGFRIDAARYIYEDGPGKQVDVKRTHEFFKKMRTLLDSYKSQKVLLGEIWANQEIIKKYYGDGANEFHMCLDFDLPYKIDNAITEQNPEILNKYLSKQYYEFPEGFCSATFLSNHDRYISRPYTHYKENPKKAVLAAALNILLPGTPFIYYGNEIGMSGNNNTDFNLRKLFNWQAVKKQTNDKNSILSWYRYLIKARNSYIALRQGDYKLLYSINKQVYSFLRKYDNENIIVISNLSANNQKTEIDVSSVKINNKKISAILGNFHGSYKNNKITINKIPAFSVVVLNIDNNVSKKIFGFSNSISSGTTDVYVPSQKYSKMFLRGTMNNWQGTIPMKLIDKSIWSVVIKLETGDYEYKYEISGEKTWQTNWGDNNNDGLGDLDGKNIFFKVKMTGNYQFNFNAETLQYSLQKIK